MTEEQKMDVKHWNVLGHPLGNVVQYLGITVNLHLCAVQCLRRTCFKRDKMIQINKHSLVFDSFFLKKKNKQNSICKREKPVISVS